MKRCPNGKRRVGRVCKRKPKARTKRRTVKRKKSPMTKFYVRGSKAKRGRTRYLTERELAAVRRERAKWVQDRRDIRRGQRRRLHRDEYVGATRADWDRVASRYQGAL
jgi:hypothetical protein